MTDHERHSQSPFKSVTHRPIGEVRISQIALEQSNDAIRDLLPGQWAFGQHNSVLFDSSSKRLFVDTFDAAVSVADRETLVRNPALTRVSAEIGGKAVMSYVANLSHVKHLLYSKLNLYIDDLAIDDHRLEQRNAASGAELLGGVILREFGELRYEGQPEFEDQAAEFCDDFERFVTELRNSPAALTVPAMASRPADRPKGPALMQLEFENDTDQSD